MNRIGRILNRLCWGIIVILGIYILAYGMKKQGLEKAVFFSETALLQAEQTLQRAASKTVFPGLVFPLKEEKEETSLGAYIARQAWNAIPLLGFLQKTPVYETEIENPATYEILITGGLHDENEIDEKTGEGFVTSDMVAKENEAALKQAEEAEAPEETKELHAAVGAEYSMEQLKDYEFLKKTFYTVEKTTAISPELLNGEALLAKDMTLSEGEGPKILIYHSHSQEGFVDSIPGDLSTTIVGVGERLTELLRDTYGYEVIHDTTVYDYIDSVLDRNKAYNNAEENVQRILEENPSIEVVIDLHRDGVGEKTRLVTEVDGKPTAQFMFVNGLSWSARNGAIDYLPNPYMEENLAFALQLKIQAEKYFPGAARRNYLKSLRYNLHLKPKALLVEVGAQTNTLEEEMNAMEPLAFILHQVLSGGA